MKRTIILSISLFCIVLGCISSRNGSNGLLLLSLFFTCIFSFVLPRNYLCPLMATLIASNRVMTYGGIISAPLLVVLIGFIRYFNLVIKLKSFVPIVFLYLLYSVITTIAVGASLILPIKTIIVLYFIYITFIYKKDDIRYELVEFISYGCIITTLVMLAINPMSLFENSRMSFTSSGQNVLGIICGAIAVVYILRFSNNKKIYGKDIIILISILLIGFLTGSRTFLVEVGIGIGLISIFMLCHPQKANILVIFCLFIFIGLSFFYIISNSSLLSEFLDSTIYRFNKLESNDISNGRFDIWDQYILFFSNHIEYLLFGGVNFGNSNIDMVAHNMILEQLASIGLVGSLIVFALYRNVFLEIKHRLNLKYKINLMTLAPLISFLTASMAAHSLLGLPQTVILFICLFNLTTNYK